MTLAQNEAPDAPEADDEKGRRRSEAQDVSIRERARDEDLQQQTVMRAYFSKKLDHVVLASEEDARALESKGFGIKENDQYLSQGL